MVVTDSGLGSGSIVDSKGSVLTNWHVVAGAKEIGVVFKPPADGAEPSRADFRSAKVIRLDEVTDLALLSVVNPPANRLPITLGSIAGLSVGTDVNAIGHPTGEAWTYTKGIVSQIRRSYEWKTESGVDHRAEVIQTQTPINPGSSGGPLFTDQGALVGVNSFVAQGEGLNFAVSVTEVRRFLAAKSNRIAKQSSGSGLKAADRKCDGQLLGETRLNDQAATGTVIDGDCDGRPDAILVAPDDPREPIELRIDSNADGKIDIIILDFERDDKWDESYADTNGDGKPDSHGFHDDGSLHPTRVESVNSG
jgi:S1-C subfamily serine protease